MISPERKLSVEMRLVERVASEDDYRKTTISWDLVHKWAESAERLEKRLTDFRRGLFLLGAALLIELVVFLDLLP